VASLKLANHTRRSIRAVVLDSERFGIDGRVYPIAINGRAVSGDVHVIDSPADTPILCRDNGKPWPRLPDPPSDTMSASPAESKGL
jgi:hypothetical protein